MKSIKVSLRALRKHDGTVDRDWFPYRDIINPERYERICSSMESYIQKYHLKNKAVYYEITDSDSSGNPLEIVIRYTTRKFLDETEHISVLPTTFNPRYSEDW